MEQKIYTYGNFPFGLGYYGIGPILEEEDSSMLVKYNTNDQKIYTALTEYGDVMLALNPTISVGDVKISIDGGSFQNITNLPTVDDSKITLTLTSDETACKQIQIRFKDLSTIPEWNDKVLNVETYGNPSAYIIEMFDGTSDANLTKINGNYLSAATLPLKSLEIVNYEEVGHAVVLSASETAVKIDGSMGAFITGHAGPSLMMEGGVTINSDGSVGVNITSNNAPAVFLNATGGAPSVGVFSDGVGLMVNSNSTAVSIQSQDTGVSISSPNTGLSIITGDAPGINVYSSTQPAIQLASNGESVVNIVNDIGKGINISTEDSAVDLSSTVGSGVVIQSQGYEPTVNIQANGTSNALHINALSGTGIVVSAMGWGVGPAVLLDSELGGGLKIVSRDSALDLDTEIGHGIKIDTTGGPGSGIRIDGLRGFDSENINESIRLKSANRALYIDATDNAVGVVIESSGDAIQLNSSGHGVQITADYGISINSLGVGVAIEGGTGVTIVGTSGPGVHVNGLGASPAMTLESSSESVVDVINTANGKGINVSAYSNAVDLYSNVGSGLVVKSDGYLPAFDIQANGTGSGLNIESSDDGINIKTHNPSSRGVYVDSTEGGLGVVIDAVGHGLYVNSDSNAVLLNSDNSTAVDITSINGIGVHVNSVNAPGMYVGSSNATGLVLQTMGDSNAVSVYSDGGNALYLSGAPAKRDIYAREIPADVSGLATSAQAVSILDIVSSIPTDNNGIVVSASNFVPFDSSVIVSATDYIISQIDNNNYGLSAIKAKTDLVVSDILGSNVDNMRLDEALSRMLSWATGKIVVTGDSFQYYKQDDTTPYFSLSADNYSRTRII